MKGFLASIFILNSLSGFACSIIGKDSNAMMKNFDWHHSTAEIYEVPKHLTKKSAYGFEWTSRYSSIVFSQVGPHLPFGGVNERGLMIDALISPGNMAKIQNAKFMEIDWIAYQLDNYSTVAEVVDHMNENTVKTLNTSTHYFLCDRFTCGVIEYIKNRAMFYPRTNPYMVLTNTNYEDSLDSLIHPGKYNMGRVGGSLSRFRKLYPISQTALTYSIANFEKILNTVNLGPLTQFKVLYQKNSITIGRSLSKAISIRSDYTAECGNEISYISNKVKGSLVLDINKIEQINDRVKDYGLPKDIESRLLLTESSLECDPLINITPMYTP